MIRRALRVFDVGSVLLMGGAGALTAALYDRLPERVPTHFGLSGQANGWMDRPAGAWGLLALTVVVWGIVRFVAVWAPGEWRKRAAQSPMAAAGFLTVALLVGIQATILWAALHPGESVGRGLSLMLGGFLFALSFVMPRLRRNPVIGIRVAWTLASDENGARTHRFAGYTFAVGGLVALSGALFAASTAGAVAVVALLAGGLAPMVYSYVIARNEA